MAAHGKLIYFLFEESIRKITDALRGYCFLPEQPGEMIDETVFSKGKNNMSSFTPFGEEIHELRCKNKGVLR